MKPGDRMIAVATQRAQEIAALKSIASGARVQANAPVELTAQRTMNGKTFDLGGGFFHHSAKIGPVHTRDDPSNDALPWEDVDLSIADNGDGTFSVRNGFYRIRITSAQVGFRYQSRRGPAVQVTLQRIGGAAPNYSAMTTSITDNVFTWHDVAPGVDVWLALKPGRIQFFKTLKDANAARQFVWDVIEKNDDNPGRPAFLDRVSLGLEADTNGKPGQLELNNTVLNQRINADGTREFLFGEQWSGRVSRITDPVTRQRAFFSDPVYPVIIDPSVNEHIPTDADDGYEGAGGWVSNRVIDYFGFYASTNENIGERFTTIAVAQGVTISAATITVNVVNATVDGTGGSGKIYADAVDSAAAWSSSSKPSGITKTTAFASVSTSSNGTKVVNVATVVQEIVNRAGWVSNNNMRFGWLNTASGTNDSSVEDYHAAGTAEAQLDITYTAGGAASPLLRSGTGRQAVKRAAFW